MTKDTAFINCKEWILSAMVDIFDVSFEVINDEEIQVEIGEPNKYCMILNAITGYKFEFSSFGFSGTILYPVSERNTIYFVVDIVYMLDTGVLYFKPITFAYENNEGLFTLSDNYNALVEMANKERLALFV